MSQKKEEMTPIQKSIAEIEAAIREMTGADYVAGICINIITANLEYERGVIEDAYRQGETDYILENIDGTGCDHESAHDYYTKTYNNERKN